MRTLPAYSAHASRQNLYEDVAFRVLAAENFATHRTIREFRALHLSEFTKLFVQVVRLAAIEAAKARLESASAKATHSVGAAPMTNANPRTKTASPRAENRISAALVFRRPKPRTALPTPSPAS